MKNYVVYDTAPPASWVGSMPIGCGRMGATLMGGVAQETLFLNEETVWSENTERKQNPEMKEILKQIRDLFLADKPVAANALADRLLGGKFERICSYEGAGKLNVELHEGDAASNYKHALDLVNGIATVSYSKHGSRYVREAFASYPDQVIAYRVTSSHAPINACISYERDRTLSCTAEGNTLTATAKTLFGNHEFCVKVRVECDGDLACRDGQILVSGAKTLCAYVVMGTQFCHGEDYVNATVFPENLNYDALRQRHVEDFSAMMSRADVTLPTIECVEALPLTEHFLADVAMKPKDESVFALQWQFGRYLLLSSSREGTLPANLQGLWTNANSSAWNSDYHTNVNLQANYWGAEGANLSECHLPLFDYMNNYLLESGKETASFFYGTHGCVVHHLSDIYGYTAPADGPWGIWPHGASWLAHHMWEHYLYTEDLDFLKNDAYQFIKEASVFFLENLARDVKGRLMYAPSASPENRYYAEEDGKRAACFLAASTTMDVQIISNLFDIYLSVCELLGIKDACSDAIAQARKELPPMRIGKHGQLMEWIEDYDETVIGHRHISHAFGLYPAAQITRATPELCRAAETTLNRRLSGKDASFQDSFGWSDTWVAALFARLRQGNRSYAKLNQFVSKARRHNLWECINIPSMGGDIFQIDANLAYVGAVNEMLLQSHEGVVALIPALPDNWHTGSFRGLRARGAYELDASWKDHSVQTFTVRAKKDGTCKIELPATQTALTFRDESGVTYKAEDLILYVPLTKNASVTLTACTEG